MVKRSAANPKMINRRLTQSLVVGLGIVVVATAAFGIVDRMCEVPSNLDAIFKGWDVDGYRTKGWSFSRDGNFVVRILSADRFVAEYHASPSFPRHAVMLAVLAQSELQKLDLKPQFFVFKDGDHELFRLNAALLPAGLDKLDHE